jgi:hypothetical protein
MSSSIKKTQGRTRSAKSNLNFSVGGIESWIRQHHSSVKFQKKMFIFLSGALEHVARELLSLSGGDESTTRIQPKTIRKGLKSSQKYGKVFSGLQISGTSFGRT